MCYVLTFHFFLFCLKWVNNLRLIWLNFQARKALRALKGVVRIQAIARGRAVRRRVKRIYPTTQLVHTKRVPSVIDQSPRKSNETSDRSKVVQLFLLQLLVGNTLSLFLYYQWGLGSVYNRFQVRISHPNFCNFHCCWGSFALKKKLILIFAKNSFYHFDSLSARARGNGVAACSRRRRSNQYTCISKRPALEEREWSNILSLIG